MNRAQRRAAVKNMKKMKVPTLKQFDMMTEDKQLATIKQLNPEFEIEMLNTNVGK